MDDTKPIAGGSAVVAVNETSAGKADIIIKAKYNGTEGFYNNSSLKFEIMAKQLYVASQRVL